MAHKKIIPVRVTDKRNEEIQNFQKTYQQSSGLAFVSLSNVVNILMGRGLQAFRQDYRRARESKNAPLHTGKFLKNQTNLPLTNPTDGTEDHVPSLEQEESQYKYPPGRLAKIVRARREQEEKARIDGGNQ